MPIKPRIIYCSWSRYKIEEWNTIRGTDFDSGSKFGDLIDLEFRKVRTQEPLLCDLEVMVHAKAMSAYKEVKVPCVVEHAGLILQGYEAQSYPGGLTQPMWDALGAEEFVSTCAAQGSEAVARAIIGYCDGSSVRVFVGETKGKLRSTPAGVRAFYWDTIFCPDGSGGKTYAEIADNNLSDKLQISQSIKALRQLISHCHDFDPILFPGV